MNLQNFREKKVLKMFSACLHEVLRVRRFAGLASGFCLAADLVVATSADGRGNCDASSRRYAISRIFPRHTFPIHTFPAYLSNASPLLHYAPRSLPQNSHP